MTTNKFLYDAGNAGDLLKHGLLAELVHWYGDGDGDDTITFLDPFGGKPDHRAVPAVVERVKKLNGFALLDAQAEIAEGRYYGSSFLVCRAAENAGKTAQVFASDKDQNTRKELADYGICELKREGFDAQDGYSVLDCVRKNEMVLIDPFGDFLPREVKADSEKQIIRKIARESKQKNATIVLFVLNKDPENCVGKKYQQLKEEHLRDAWVLSCPPLEKNTGVRGESTYHLEVLLVSPRLKEANAKALHDRLRDYAKALTKILNVEVCLHSRFSGNHSTMEPPDRIDCDTDPASISAERAHELIARVTAPLKPVETVAVRTALGRVAAVDIKSRVQVPNHTNSAMDGYAFRGADLSNASRDKHATTLRVIGTSMAGKPFHGKVRAGQCVRIMTGAVMPNGTDSVVAQEQVTRDGERIVVQEGGAQVGANVRYAGEDIEVGDIAIAAGCRLAPSHIGLAASLGFAELPVLRRPRVAFFSNGDELRPLGTALDIGELYDSNRYTLHGMLSQLGVEMVDFGIVPDDAAALDAAIAHAAECADLVITSAGASVGDADYIRDIVARRGQVVFHKVAIKPGRPLIFGKVRKNSNGECLFFGLPGNPVSVMVTFQIFVAPALRLLAGEVAQPTTPLRLMVKSVDVLKKRRGRAEYQRGVLCRDESGETVVRSTGVQGSGILRSMGEANCFIILPTDCAHVNAGERVEVEPF